MSAPIKAKTTPKQRLLVVLALGLIPWTLITITTTTSTVTLVFPFGLVDTNSWHFLTLPEYLGHSGGQIAPFMEAWPIGALLYVCAFVGAVGGVFGYEDPRLTGSFLVLTAVSQIPLVLGFSRRLGYTAVPLGTVLMLVVAWWVYWPMVKGSAE